MTPRSPARSARDGSRSAATLVRSDAVTSNAAFKPARLNAFDAAVSANPHERAAGDTSSHGTWFANRNTCVPCTNSIRNRSRSNDPSARKGTWRTDRPDAGRSARNGRYAGVANATDRSSPTSTRASSITPTITSGTSRTCSGSTRQRSRRWANPANAAARRGMWHVEIDPLQVEVGL